VACGLWLVACFEHIIKSSYLEVGGNKKALVSSALITLSARCSNNLRGIQDISKKQQLPSTE
jgi:hypothetical protein